jgi:hypothetical protein
MGVSAAALLLCLLIVIVPALRRRPVGHGATGLAAGAAEFRIGPLEERGVSRRGGAVVIPLVTGIGVAFVVHPLVGLAAVILIHLAYRSRRWRFAQRIAPAAIMGGVAVYVTVTQLVHAHLARAEWPGTFDVARIPTWVALTLVGVVVLVDGIFTQDDEGSGA